MDVAIVGAGMAGLKAASVLAAHGVAVELFEASPRVGGRARTVRGAHGEAIDLGPEFVHGEAARLRDLAEAPGLPLEPVSAHQHVQRAGALVRADDLWQRFDALLAAADAGPDRSARDYVRVQRMAHDDAVLFALFVEGFYGAPLGDIGVASVASDEGGLGGEEDGAAPAQQRVRDGYEAVAAELALRLVARGVAIHLGTPVRVIDWHSDRVVLGHDGGAAAARCAIVTLPLALLQAPAAIGLRFAPELAELRAPLAQLAMGQVVKVMLELRAPVWRVRGELGFLHDPAGPFPTYWVRSHDGGHTVTAWAGGPHATMLTLQHPADVLQLAVDGFAGALAVPAQLVRDALVAAHHHDYQHDAWTRGAYSYTRVGGGDAAAALCRPLADRLFLAGEATDAHLEGTVTGALASGARAAQQVLDVLRGTARFSDRSAR